MFMKVIDGNEVSCTVDGDLVHDGTIMVEVAGMDRDGNKWFYGVTFRADLDVQLIGEDGETFELYSISDYTLAGAADLAECDAGEFDGLEAAAVRVNGFSTSCSFMYGDWPDEEPPEYEPAVSWMDDVEFSPDLTAVELVDGRPDFHATLDRMYSDFEADAIDATVRHGIAVAAMERYCREG